MLWQLNSLLSIFCLFLKNILKHGMPLDPCLFLGKRWMGICLIGMKRWIHKIDDLWKILLYEKGGIDARAPLFLFQRKGVGSTAYTENFWRTTPHADFRPRWTKRLPIFVKLWYTNLQFLGWIFWQTVIFQGQNEPHNVTFSWPD